MLYFISSDILLAYHYREFLYYMGVCKYTEKSYFIIRDSGDFYLNLPVAAYFGAVLSIAESIEGVLSYNDICTIHISVDILHEKCCTEYVNLGLSYCKRFAIPELQASQKFCIHMYIDRLWTQLSELKK